MNTTIHYDFDQLHRVPISRVVATYDTLRRQGCRQVAHCPWHQDEHPSLTLYENKTENHCHCFSCGKHGSALDYVMAVEHCDLQQACAIVAQIGGIIPSQGSQATAPRQRIHTEQRVDYSYVPMEWVEQHVSADNSLCVCMNRLFNPYLVSHVTEEYLLGSLETDRWPNATLFPTIDEHNRVRNVKMQYYYATDTADHRFATTEKSSIEWIGKRLAQHGIVSPKDARFDLNSLFGAHLLGRYPDRPVALVESPKNAVVGALALPKYVWVAAGNKDALKPQVVAPLRGRKVIVYPDRDAIADWTQRLDAMHANFVYEVSDFCEVAAPKDQPKFDIADHIIAMKLAKGSPG